MKLIDTSKSLIKLSKQEFRSTSENLSDVCNDCCEIIKSGVDCQKCGVHLLVGLNRVKSKLKENKDK